MKYFLILNPGSGGGGSRRQIRIILDLFRQSDAQYTYEYTTSLSHARQLSEKANRAGFNIVAAIGGDGTINKVLNGFYDGSGRRISKAAMGVVHTGTSPDFCKSYGIPVKTEQATRLLLSPTTRNIRIGKLICCKENLPELNNRGISEVEDAVVRYFGCCANVGLGASLARHANSGIRKFAGDKPGTFLSLLKILFTYHAGTSTRIIDGKPGSVDKMYNTSIGRTHHIASGIKVCNELTDDDDRFYCLTVMGLNLRNIPDLLRQAYSGKPIRNSSHINLEYCRSIEFPGNYRNPEVELDGDPAGFLPCKMEAARDPLELVCPSH
jgi:diacylglycerol kinase family enzyme